MAQKVSFALRRALGSGPGSELAALDAALTHGMADIEAGLAKPASKYLTS